MADLNHSITAQHAQVDQAPRSAYRKPTARQWTVHIALFLSTFATTTIFGIWMNLPLASEGNASAAETSGFAGSLWLIPLYYLQAVLELIRYAFAHPAVLRQGLVFSGSLLAILASHESGHYLFCRYYGVDATLPFFVPQPPLLMPGTFGAFIRMKSAVPSRRALFDIGLAGPLAGFVVMLPIAFAGVLTVQPTVAQGSGWYFHDPLLFHLIAWLFGIHLESTTANSLYLAAWFGALVTALNLMPVGQLDGGHGTFSVFGERGHWWVARVAFFSMLLMTLIGWLRYSSPAMFLYVVLLAVMLRVRHPQPEQMEPLGITRTIIAMVTLLVFVLCFLPFPITIT